MKLLLFEIPPEGVRINWEEIKDFQLEQVKGTLEEGLQFLKKPEGELFIKPSKKGVVCKGKLECSVLIKCARCLKEFELVIRDEFEVLYVPLREMSFKEEVELSLEDMETGFLKEDLFDVEEVLNERIWLSIPMKPLCKEDCKGLCPYCGKDLNEGDCGCKSEYVDPRFAVLRELKIKLKNKG